MQASNTKTVGFWNQKRTGISNKLTVVLVEIVDLTIV